MIAWLLDTLFYTGALIALVLLVRRPVARHFGPQTAYMLWVLPFVRLLLPPIVLPASFAPEAERVTTTVVNTSASAEFTTVDYMPQAELPPVPTDMTPLAHSLSLADLVNVAADLLLPLWLAGAAAFLVWRMVTYRRMRDSLLAEARPVGDVGRVRLVETPAVSAPVAFGVRDKVVAMPQFFMAQPDLQMRDLAIAHELAHHRGNDLLANFAAQALLALHWFNPIAWLGWRAMRRDQEAACDARVVSGRCHQDRVRYAALIANVAVGPRLALAAPMACPVLGEKSIIHRLRSLSMKETTRRQRVLGRSLVAVGALALPLTASFTYAAEEEQQQSAAPARQSKRIVIVEVENGADPEDPSLYTHVFRHDDGTTVVLKTDKPVDDSEAQRRVAEAIARTPDVPLPPSPPAAPPAPAAPALPAAVAMVASPATPVTPALPRATGATASQLHQVWSGKFDQAELDRRMEQLERDLERAADERERALDIAAEQRERALDRAAEQRERQLERAAAQRERDAAAREAQLAQTRIELEHKFSADGALSRAISRTVSRSTNAALAQAASYSFDTDCDDAPARRNGCKSVVTASALAGLRAARASIAGNRSIPAEARAEALSEIDESIAEMLEES